MRLFRLAMLGFVSLALSLPTATAAADVWEDVSRLSDMY